MVRVRLVALTGLPAAALLTWFASRSPDAVERIYSRSIYPAMAQAISRITGILPVSFGELIIFLATLSVIAGLYRLARQIRAHGPSALPSIAKLALGLLAIVSAVYFVFTVTWGLNYYRLPYADIVGLKIEPASVDRLAELCSKLISDANRLREVTAQDGAAVMRLETSRSGVFTRADAGFRQAAASVPELGGSFGRPKGLLLSRALSYAGLAGIYFPYTVEANVNAEIPEFSLPSTTCHEMAHQRGFAREDEANYIAYVVCMFHPDVDFQYSGTMLAAIHSMNALWRYDRDLYKKLFATYSPAVRRDLESHDQFWTRFEGPVERASNKINDTYLKTQGQRDGTQSYGRMVDLLLAEHQRQKERPGL